MYSDLQNSNNVAAISALDRCSISIPKSCFNAPPTLSPTSAVSKAPTASSAPSAGANSAENTADNSTSYIIGGASAAGLVFVAAAAGFWIR
jgi:hypothetical protein